MTEPDLRDRFDTIVAPEGEPVDIDEALADFLIVYAAEETT